MWMQVGVVKWNERSCVFGNGTKVITGATSPSAIRGNSISMLVLDEYAFIPTQQADEFYKSVYPTISSGKESKLVIFLHTQRHEPLLQDVDGCQGRQIEVCDV